MNRYQRDPTLGDVDARLSKPPRHTGPPLVLLSYCERCREQRPLAAFEKSGQGLFDVASICKPCRVVEEALKSGSVEVQKLIRKECTACGLSKPLAEFARRARGTSGKGRQKVCEQCTAEGKGGYTST